MKQALSPAELSLRIRSIVIDKDARPISIDFNCTLLYSNVIAMSSVVSDSFIPDSDALPPKMSKLAQVPEKPLVHYI